MNDKEKRPEEKVRRGLVNFRAGLVRRFGEKGAKRIILWVPMALLIIAVLVTLFLLIPIRSIEVFGDVSIFNEAEIIDAAEIGEGDSMFLRSSGDIENTIRKNLPLTEKVSVKKSLFGNLVIEIEFAEIEFYTCVSGKYYAINGDLKVLDVSESAAEYRSKGAALVILPLLREPSVGDKLVFYDTVEEKDSDGNRLYEVKDESYYSYVSTFLNALVDSGFSMQTNGVILENKFEITLIYDMKYKVNFGGIASYESKFKVLFGILSDPSMKNMDKVYIDLFDPARPTAKSEPTLDFSQFGE